MEDFYYNEDYDPSSLWIEHEPCDGHFMAPKISYYEDQLFCNHCDFSTLDPTEFKQHLKSHKKVYDCPYCGYNTIRTADLRRHINAKHTNKKQR